MSASSHNNFKASEWCIEALSSIRTEFSPLGPLHLGRTLNLTNHRKVSALTDPWMTSHAIYPLIVNAGSTDHLFDHFRSSITAASTPRGENPYL